MRQAKVGKPLLAGAGLSFYPACSPRKTMPRRGACHLLRQSLDALSELHPATAGLGMLSGEIEIIRVDALDLVDALSCYSDAVFNHQVSQPKSVK